MNSSRLACAIAAASLTLGSFGAFAQGQVRDRNASNNPEIYQRTHPEDQSGRDLQGGPNVRLQQERQQRDNTYNDSRR